MRVSIAPMMDWTDRHDRFFLRLISPNVLLYTEMITTGALLHGDRARFLAFHPDEQPLAIQLGGCDPKELAQCAQFAELAGFCEVNLNVGCPSPRVQKGAFGACLMAEPELVADCVHAMQAVVSIPVTVKTRIGIDDYDEEAMLWHFVKTVSKAGCHTFIIHARKAWLKGLSPKQNREIPPLRYDLVAKLKAAFPQLHIILNGGIKTSDEVKQHLQLFDGVMLGREAYQNPYFLSEIERDIFHNDAVLTRVDVVRALMPYVQGQLQQGVPLKCITRHILGLFKGESGAKHWRRYLSDHANHEPVSALVLHQALQSMQAEGEYYGD